MLNKQYQLFDLTSNCIEYANQKCSITISLDNRPNNIPLLLSLFVDDDARRFIRPKEGTEEAKSNSNPRAAYAKRVSEWALKTVKA